MRFKIFYVLVDQLLGKPGQLLQGTCSMLEQVAKGMEAKYFGNCFELAAEPAFCNGQV